MASRRYFGTDGVRGRAGEAPMTALFALQLGAATAEHLRNRGVTHPTVAVGTDTRRSSAMLAAAVTAGLSSRGADVISLGVMPTPGVAHLVTALGADAGVVVSASHNPFDDNGLKLFDASGRKLADSEEAEIEAAIDGLDPSDDLLGLAPRTHDGIGGVRRYRFEDGHYEHHLLGHAPYLDGLRVALDCANGAAARVAPRVFQRIGARLDVINAEPDGVNINAQCGSTDMAALVARVTEAKLDVGVAFDGDADRALLVDRNGRVVSGDHMLAICAVARNEPRVVATSMTNLGVERWLAERGVVMERVAVGDRYVYERLIATNARLGGEQSGHLLFLDKATTGDGILSALQVLGACRAAGVALEAWMDQIPSFPQRLHNVPVPNGARDEIARHPLLAAAVAAAEDELGELGRIVVRPSGTEPLVRVMVEARDEAVVERLSRQVVAAVERLAAGELGAEASDRQAAATMRDAAAPAETSSE
jgi:phosphoglucosamine mutase